MKNAVTVVDDCGELRCLFALILEQEFGVSCLGLTSLSEVMSRSDDVLDSRAIILDINLGPGEPDGVVVYEWLRSQDYRGQIFFFTGHARESPFVRRAADTGVPVLEKPMSPDALIYLLQDYIGERQRECAS